MNNMWESLREINPYLAVGIFFAYTVIDALYAYYTLSVTRLKPLHAAFTSFVMHFLLAFGVINYVDNFLYVIPLAVGSFVGTYVLVKREQLIQNDDERK